MLDEDDHENDSLMGRTLVTGMTTKYSRKSSATKAAILAQANANVRIAETKDGNVLDLLDHNNDQSKQVRFADMEDDDDEDGWSEDGAMEFDEDGRLVVVDEDDDVTLSTKKSKHLQGDVDDDWQWDGRNIDELIEKLFLGSAYLFLFSIYRKTPFLLSTEWKCLYLRLKCLCL